MSMQNTEHMRILAIEDNPGDVELLREMLDVTGDHEFDLECASRLSTGLKRLANGGIDIVALDLGLPDSQGLDTLSQVRAQSPEVPLVVMTNLGDDTVALKAVKEGAQDYLVKGEIDGNMIWRAINYAIARADAHTALRASESALNAMLEENPDGIMIIDKDGVVRYANPAVKSIFGCSKEEFIGQPFGYAISTEQPVDIVAIWPSEEERYAELRAAEMDWGDASIYLVSIHDHTERRRAENALKMANVQLQMRNTKLAQLTEAAEQFVDTVSHEFRTPLAVIKEFTSILADGIGGPITKDQADYLGIMGNSVQDLAQMVDDLLDTSRLKAGTLRVNRRRWTVAEIIKSVRPILLNKAGAKNITLVEDIAPNLSDVYADKEKAGRILVNIAVNAIKFSPEHGQVTIKAAETLDRGVEISVIDQGPGMSGDEIKTIFGRFTQVGAGAKASTKGFGLGLSIAKDLARLNFGEIRVESTPGEGSSFFFALPRYDWREIVDRYLHLLRGAKNGVGVSGLQVTLAEHDGSLDSVHGFLASACRPEDLILGDGEEAGLILLGQTDTPQDWAERIRETRVQYMKRDSMLHIPEIQIAVVNTWRCPVENKDIVSWVLDELTRREPLGSQESADS